MIFLFLFIFIFKIYFIKTYHQIASESTIYTYTSSNYQFFLKINICKYVKNDSYIMEGNSSSKIIDIFSKSYHETNEVIIGGSDLKFIQSATVSWTGGIKDDQNHIEIEKSISKGLVTAYTEFKVNVSKIGGYTSYLYLYVVKNDNTDFVNICDIYRNNNNMVVLMDNINVNSGNYQLINFKLKSNFKREIFKVIILDYTIYEIFYKNKAIFIETIPYHFENLFILLGLIIGVIIIGVILFIRVKRKNKNKIDNMTNGEEKEFTINGTPYEPFDKPNSDSLTPDPLASYN